MPSKGQQGPIAAVRRICSRQGHGIRLLELLPLPAAAGDGYMAILQVPDGLMSTGPEVRELTAKLQEVKGITRAVVNLYP